MFIFSAPWKDKCTTKPNRATYTLWQGQMYKSKRNVVGIKLQRPMLATLQLPKEGLMLQLHPHRPHGRIHLDVCLVMRPLALHRHRVQWDTGLRHLYMYQLVVWHLVENLPHRDTELLPAADVTDGMKHLEALVVGILMIVYRALSSQEISWTLHTKSCFTTWYRS